MSKGPVKAPGAPKEKPGAGETGLLDSHFAVGASGAWQETCHFRPLRQERRYGKASSRGCQTKEARSRDRGRASASRWGVLWGGWPIRPRV